LLRLQVSVAVAECITIPIDTVKVRLMLQGELGAVQQYSGGVNAFTTIFKEEGIAGKVGHPSAHPASHPTTRLVNTLVACRVARALLWGVTPIW
jgi:hypothetical protein